MKCPTCDADTSVLSTRGEVRRRECFNGHRFSTLEIPYDSRADQQARRREHLAVMEEVRRQAEKEKTEIREAQGTLQEIATRFNRSLSYVWTIKRRDYR